MTRSVIHVLLIVLVLAGVSSPHAQEAIKLRPLAPVYADGQGLGLESPQGVACPGDFRLLAADTGNGRLLQYTFDAEMITPGPAIVTDKASHPIRVEVDTSGDLLILDAKLRRIVRLSSTGEFKAYIEPSGLQDGFTPRNFTLDSSDNLYILDIAAERVLVLDKAGTLQRQILFPAEFGFFSDLAVDDNGNLFAIDSVHRQVYSAGRHETVLAPLTADLKDDLDFPTAISVDGAGRLFVADQHGGGIVILGRDGSFRGRQSVMGWSPGLLRYPTDLCIDETGILFVADRQNNRIQGFAIVE